MIVSKLGISPVSQNVIDSVIQYSQEHQVQLMLVASRNQIDADGGYVGLTSKKFISYVKEKSPTVIICRDHSGSDVKAALNDIEAGFDLIHIDCSGCRDIRQVTESLLRMVKESKVLFEVGTEENTGASTDPDKFREDLKFITKLVQPEFIVGGTGSLVKEIYQVGFFDYKIVKELTSIAHSFGVKFKEHNADYSSLVDLRQRVDVGVDAVNIGPELGVAQTKIVIVLAQQYGLFNELNAFLRLSLESHRWEKWVYGNPSAPQRAVIAGHYIFNSAEYKGLVHKLGQMTDVNKKINERIAALLDHYTGGLK